MTKLLNDSLSLVEIEALIESPRLITFIEFAKAMPDITSDITLSLAYQYRFRTKPQSKTAYTIPQLIGQLVCIQFAPFINSITYDEMQIYSKIIAVSHYFCREGGERYYHSRIDFQGTFRDIPLSIWWQTHLNDTIEFESLWFGTDWYLKDGDNDWKLIKCKVHLL